MSFGRRVSSTSAVRRATSSIWEMSAQKAATQPGPSSVAIVAAAAWARSSLGEALLSSERGPCHAPRQSALYLSGPGTPTMTRAPVRSRDHGEMTFTPGPDAPNNAIGAALERIAGDVNFNGAVGVISDRLAERHREIADLATSTVAARAVQMVENPMKDLHARLSEPGGPLDFTARHIDVPIPSSAAAALLPAAATAADLFAESESMSAYRDMARWEMPEIYVEQQATEASIRELVEATQAESVRNLARWDASEQARAEERRIADELRAQAAEERRVAAEEREQASEDRRKADEDRHQADLDRAAAAHRYKVMLWVSIIAAVLTGIGAFVGGLALAG